MVRRGLLLINLIGILLISCAHETVPKKEFNIATIRITNTNGIISSAGKPFTGRLYALENADTVFIKEYLLGTEDGLHKIWYPNCQVAEIRYYQAGRKTGLHTGFWPNGQKKYEYRFIDDLYEKTQLEWYPSGKTFSRKAYKDGHENGIQQTWSEDGKLRTNYEAKNGRNYGNIGKKNCISKT